MVKKIKITDKTNSYLVSSDESLDDCPVCQLLKKCEEENREPTLEEIEKVMNSIPAKHFGGISTE